VGFFKIPGRAYLALARILDLPGTEGLEGMQDEVIPVQDLSRILQQAQVKHTVFQKSDQPDPGVILALQWNDVSDWDEVRINGIVVGTDDDLPLLSDDRFIVMCGLGISDTRADYTSAQINRQLPADITQTMQLMAWGAIVSSHEGPVPVAPFTLPQRLVPSEVQVRLVEIVGATPLATFNWTIQMISAEPGVLAAFPGF